MNRRNFLKSIGIFSLGIGSRLSARNSFTRTAGESPPKNSRPNIVFILADDFGYSSLNSYGADKNLVRTPHIDQIADAGMRFKEAYTPASICSPTRYGFLTGRYPWRTSLKSGVVNLKDPLLPNPDRVTIADWLKERGYNTAAIGKWHLGYGEAKWKTY
jgi:arylsulfatase A-like enzyme